MLLPLLLSLSSVVFVLALSTPDTRVLHLGGQGINLWKLRANTLRLSEPRPALQETAQTPLSLRGSSLLEKKYPALEFDQPLDHFDKANKHTFKQRYWVDDRFYQPGGPVFVLDGGETSGANRLPFMEKGILAM